MPYETTFGQTLCVAGGTEELGSWCADSCLQMTWQEGNVWTADCDLPTGSDIEYKYIVRNEDGSVEWQPGENNKLSVPDVAPQGSAISVQDDWLGADQQVFFGDVAAITNGASSQQHGNNGFKGLIPELPEIPSKIKASGPVDIGAPEDVTTTKERSTYRRSDNGNGNRVSRQDLFKRVEMPVHLNGSSPFAERI